MDAANSIFNYLRVNPQTGEAEMRYHLEFADAAGQRYMLEGVKYMQKNSANQAIADVLGDYTTLYTHLYQRMPDGTDKELGIGYMKFRTFENLAAVSSLASFFASFRITGTSDPAIQLQARLRFIAFTAQFVEREYDPLGLPVQRFAAAPAPGGFGSPSHEGNAARKPDRNRGLGGSPSTRLSLLFLAIERIEFLLEKILISGK